MQAIMDHAHRLGHRGRQWGELKAIMDHTHWLGKVQGG